MTKVEQVLSLIKRMSNDDKELVRQQVNKVAVKNIVIKRCQYCEAPLYMAIEKENKCCWDCHYEGKDYLSKEENNIEYEKGSS